MVAGCLGAARLVLLWLVQGEAGRTVLRYLPGGLGECDLGGAESSLRWRQSHRRGALSVSLSPSVGTQVIGRSVLSPRKRGWFVFGRSGGDRVGIGSCAQVSVWDVAASGLLAGVVVMFVCGRRLVVVCG